MKNLFALCLAAWIAAAVAPAALAQNAAWPQARLERVSPPQTALLPRPDGEGQPAPQNLGQGMAAIQKAAAAHKYLFVFFWKEKNQQTDAMWSVFSATVGKLSDWADGIAVRVDDPAEKPVVDRFNVSRAPMPFVVAMAANGAVTKAFAARFDESQLRQAFVSPCTEQCFKALQDRKLVLMCVQNVGLERSQVMLPQGIVDFTADPRYAQFTQVVLLNPADQTEAPLLRDLQVDPRTAGPVVVFMAPPASVLGKFNGRVTKEQLLATLVSAQSGPCAGGKCGPGGCGPKR